ncbi:hypothetical protein L210DRAFT_849443 [Boletus edulis BED1]|uniref:Uncharacterized protein n=1 Tax=Boletus edulis BED1 TaxID=1328754 RepID=A0AAD4GJ87_BOLED|nr:hypothetical protein L210DRAFT_849443 [Boletus edulis BED1]
MTSRFTESTYLDPPTIISTNSRSRSHSPSYASSSGAEEEDRQREEATRMTKQALLSPGCGTRTATLPIPGQEPQLDGVVGDCEVEMDKSVLAFGRPSFSTESLPVHSPLVGHVPTISTRIVHRSPDQLSPSSPKPRSQQYSPSELQSSRPAPAPPTGSSPQTDVPKVAAQRTPRKRAVSNTSPNSVFRLLPRETRSALRRMLCFDPKARTTMGELLWGRCGGDGIIALEEGEKCGCERHRETEQGHDSDQDDNDQDSDEEYDEDLGDSWIRDIETCTGQHAPTHVHVRIPSDEKTSKRLFF